MRFHIDARITTKHKEIPKGSIIHFGECDTWIEVEEIVNNRASRWEKNGEEFIRLNRPVVSKKFVEIHDRSKGICLRYGNHSTNKGYSEPNEPFAIVKISKNKTYTTYPATIILHNTIAAFKAYDDCINYLLHNNMSYKTHYILIDGYFKLTIRPLNRGHSYLKQVLATEE